MAAIRIDGEIMQIEECGVQLALELGGATNLHISVDIVRFPMAYDTIVHLYETRKVFCVSHPKFDARRSFIKTIDIEFGRRLSICVGSQDFTAKDMAHHREELIRDIIGEDDSISFFVI